MAPHLTTALQVARLGSRAVRYLIRPARSTSTAQQVAEWGHDPWLPTPQNRVRRKLERGANLTRRGLGLLTLLALAVLGTLLLGVAVLVSGAFAAGGVELGWWFMGFTLLLGLLGAYWTARRASALLRAEADVPLPTTAPAQLPASLENDETALLHLLRQHERALPEVARPAFYQTVIATRDALRLTADDAALSRETFDVRQAAREDLPELLDAFGAVPPSAQSNAQLLEQLSLIETRMQQVMAVRGAGRQRKLHANGKYLHAKYRGEEEKEDA